MIEVLKQALEALEKHYPYEDESGIIKLSLGRYMNGLQYLRQAIAELESQKQGEPVACKECHLKDTVYDLLGDLKVANLKLSVRSQRTWVGLTDEEIEEGIKQSWVTEQAFQSAAWWAEAKLKEKNS